MPHSIALWRARGEQLERLNGLSIDRERRLEDWIESNPEILGDKLLIVGRQVRTAFGGIIDLLAVDDDGRCVVIELKRGRTPRDIVAQTLDYVSWVATLTDAEVRDRTASRLSKPFNEAFQEFFGGKPPEQLNTDQRMLIVGTDIDEATARIVEHLTQRYGVDINVVALTYFQNDGTELLARTWAIEPEVLDERVDSHVSANDTPAEPTGLWHVNVGVHPNDLIQRNWDDPRRYNFISAGQGPKWRDQIARLSPGDHIYAYLNGFGYVGSGIVVSRATRASEFEPPGFDKPLSSLPLQSTAWFVNSDDPDLSEYMIGVRWTKTVDANHALRVAHPLRGTVGRIWSPDLAATLRSAFPE